jgi:hypothetical protein
MGDKNPKKAPKKKKVVSKATVQAVNEGSQDKK